MERYTRIYKVNTLDIFHKKIITFVVLSRCMPGRLRHGIKNQSVKKFLRESIRLHNCNSIQFVVTSNLDCWAGHEKAVYFKFVLILSHPISDSARNYEILSVLGWGENQFYSAADYKKFFLFSRFARLLKLPIWKHEVSSRCRSVFYLLRPA